MQSYKVQFTKTYVIDIQAHDETEATIKGREEFERLEENNMQHYNETDEDIVVFDVTGTDDDAFIINE